MRDRARLRAVAEAKSRRATSDDLREASKRVKQIEQELLQIDLHDETKRGEDRLQRYSRVLRLRALREDFQAERPLKTQPHMNSMVLALVMVVAAFLLTLFCAGGALAGVQLLQQKPDPLAPMSAFWDDMEHQNYTDIHTNYLSSTLRVSFTVQDFVTSASQADMLYGNVTNAVLTKQVVDTTAGTASLTYTVTRGNRLSYNSIIVLTLRGGSWGIDDLGATIDPTKAGVPTPNVPESTPTPSTPETPTNTPTSLRSNPGYV